MLKQCVVWVGVGIMVAVVVVDTDLSPFISLEFNTERELFLREEPQRRRRECRAAKVNCFFLPCIELDVATGRKDEGGGSGAGSKHAQHLFHSVAKGVICPD